MDAGAMAGPLGARCADGNDCRSGVCYRVGSGAGVCTEDCVDVGDCVDGWTCDAFGGRTVCACQPKSEMCDGRDDDCDARVDEGKPDLLGCTTGEICEAGACSCPPARMCGAGCVDLQVNPHHCGECDLACDPGQRCTLGYCCTPRDEVCNGADDDCDGETDEGSAANIGCAVGETCSGGTCSCETMCDGDCVDITSDPAHCGGCDSACPADLDCVDRVCCEAAGSRVDVLFVIDNSGSMQQEQAALRDQLPRMVNVLATGDLDGDGQPESEPVRDLHLGVITTDLGSGDATGVDTCEVASASDDGVLRRSGDTSIDGCRANYGIFFNFDPMTDDPDTVARDFSCVASVGTGGCGFEQPLEAVLKATTGSTAPITFFDGARGHADVANAGFLREDSTLVLVLLTDEDDCSVSNADLFTAGPGAPFAGTPFNVRCSEHPEALHQLGRYVDGLLATRDDPRDLIFAVIGGVPADLVQSGVTPDYGAILANPAMQTVLAEDGETLVPSCDEPGLGKAYPPRRLVRTAQAIQAQGGAGIVGSICQPDADDPMRADLSAPITDVLARVSARLRESCISTP